jgi:rhamnulokinase
VAGEYTIATTTQFYDPRRRDWDRELFESLGLPDRILPQVTPPGSVLGTLLDSVAAEAGVKPVPVVVPASHDTGSAVAAVPASEDDWAFLSSGTWSLLGVEARGPVINEQTLRLNFTNEGGAWDTIRLLKNISGLWLLEECRREWSRQGVPLDYAELCEAALAAKPFAAVIDPDDPSFLSPGDMPGKIAAYCARTGQAVPEGYGAMVRTIFESLALKYREVLRMLEEIRGRKFRVLHVVGGGSKNAVLCQFTADVTGLPVLAGPEEATAIGNVLLQAMALGCLRTPEEAREVVRQSYQPRLYEPRSAGGEPPPLP